MHEFFTKLRSSITISVHREHLHNDEDAAGEHATCVQADPQDAEINTLN